MIYSISDYKALIDLSKEIQSFIFNDPNYYSDNNVLFGVALSLFNFATKIWLYFLVLAYLFSK